MNQPTVPNMFTLLIQTLRARLKLEQGMVVVQDKSWPSVTQPILPSLTGSPWRRGIHLIVCGRSGCHATRHWKGHCQPPRRFPYNPRLQRKSNECRSPGTYHLRLMLNSRTGTTSFRWAPDRKGVPGNEITDTEATTASDPPPSPISYASAKSLIRRTLTDSSLSVVTNVLNWLMARWCLARGDVSKIEVPDQLTVVKRRRRQINGWPAISVPQRRMQWTFISG